MYHRADGQVQEKFMLDLSEEDAIKQFEVLLNDTSYLTVDRKSVV